MLHTTDLNSDDRLANLPHWPTGPIERQVMRELDHTESLSALRAARDALIRRRS